MQNISVLQSAKCVVTSSPNQERFAYDFPTWKTMKLGTHQSTNELREALKANGNGIGRWANEIFGKHAFTVASEETEIELVQVTNAELGFKDGAYLQYTYKRALELGLELCPNEVGPQLRLQYKDQPKDEWLFTAMDPIATSGGYLGVFYVIHDDGLELRGGDGHPNHFRNSSNSFVFARRKGRSP